MSRCGCGQDHEADRHKAVELTTNEPDAVAVYSFNDYPTLGPTVQCLTVTFDARQHRWRWSLVEHETNPLGVDRRVHASGWHVSRDAAEAEGRTYVANRDRRRERLMTRNGKWVYDR